MPLTNRLSLPIFFSIALISGPPPCTSTTLMPTSCISTMSFITASLSSGLIMALPPYLTTIVSPAHFLIYGIACTSTCARSPFEIPIFFSVLMCGNLR